MFAGSQIEEVYALFSYLSIVLMKSELRFVIELAVPFVEIVLSDFVISFHVHRSQGHQVVVAGPYPDVLLVGQWVLSPGSNGCYKSLK